MAYSVEKIDATTIRLAGDVFTDEAPEVVSNVEALFAATSGELVVDLSGLKSANSAMLSVLLCLLRSSASQNKTLIFSGISTRLFDLSRVSGLDKILPFRLA